MKDFSWQRITIVDRINNLMGVDHSSAFMDQNVSFGPQNDCFGQHGYFGPQRDSFGPQVIEQNINF